MDWDLSPEHVVHPLAHTCLLETATNHPEPRIREKAVMEFSNFILSQKLPVGNKHQVQFSPTAHKPVAVTTPNAVLIKL